MQYPALYLTTTIVISPTCIVIQLKRKAWNKKIFKTSLTD